MFPKFDAVVDTNVIADIYTFRDVIISNEIHMLDLEHSEARYRRARTRDGLLLAYLLHEQGMLTYGLRQEAVDKTLELAPPDILDDIKVAFTYGFLYFVKGRILGGWVHSIEGIDSNVRGTECDDLFLQRAIDLKVPLITNEGFSQNGTILNKKKSLRVKAEKRGVAVYTPYQFYQNHSLNEKITCRKFLARFSAEASTHIAAQYTPQARKNVEKIIQDMYCFYQFILLGYTN